MSFSTSILSQSKSMEIVLIVSVYNIYLNQSCKDTADGSGSTYDIYNMSPAYNY